MDATRTIRPRTTRGSRSPPVGKPGDHSVFALYNGGGRFGIAKPAGGLGLGRYFRPDELEVIPEPP